LFAEVETSLLEVRLWEKPNKEYGLAMAHGSLNQPTVNSSRWFDAMRYK
jgi:hypothetical protein